MARTPDILVTTHSLLTVSGHLQLLDGLSGSKSDPQDEHHNHENMFLKRKSSSSGSQRLKGLYLNISLLACLLMEIGDSILLIPKS